MLDADNIFNFQQILQILNGEINSRGTWDIVDE